MAQQGMLTSSGGFKPFDYAEYLKGLEDMYPWLYGAGLAEDVTTNIGDVDLSNIDLSGDYEEPSTGPRSTSEQIKGAYDYYGLNDNFISGQNIISGMGMVPGMGLAARGTGMLADYGYGINPTQDVMGLAGGFIGGALGPDIAGSKTVGELQRNIAMGVASRKAGQKAGDITGKYLTGREIGDWYNPTYFSEEYSSHKMPGSIMATNEIGREFPDMVKGTNEYSMMFDALVDEYTGGFAANKGLTDEQQSFIDKGRLAEGYDWQGNAIENFTPYDEVADDIGMLSPYAGRLRTTDVPREGEREMWLEEENRNIWADQYRDKFDRKKNPMVATPLTYQQAMEAANGPDPYGKGYKAFGQEGDDTSRTEDGHVFHGPGYNWNSTDGGASGVNGGGTDFSPSSSSGPAEGTDAHDEASANSDGGWD